MSFRVHRGHRIQEHSEKVMKYQQQGIPLRKAVVSSHYQCSQQFSAYAMSVSVQVWESINMGRLKVVKDPTRF